MPGKDELHWYYLPRAMKPLRPIDLRPLAGRLDVLIRLLPPGAPGPRGLGHRDARDGRRAHVRAADELVASG